MNSSKDTKYMQRCLDLARLGAGRTGTNPMVGAVVVHRGRIIGEGYHENYGMPHAEVNAIGAVNERQLLKESTIYVNLEPCAHHGKTPPCANLIVETGIPEVVIGTLDPFSEVAGKGVEILRNAGISVRLGVLEAECNYLNKRFFTYHSKKRPYIILKWAESADGYMDIERGPGTPVGINWISNSLSKTLVHKWRTEEQAILVGTNTLINDNPKLTARLWPGNSPMRLALDKQLRAGLDLEIHDGSFPSLVFTEKELESSDNLEFVKVNFQTEVLDQVLQELYQRGVQSLIVEGGKKVLESFLKRGCWDEARVIIGKRIFGSGIEAPVVKLGPVDEVELLGDKVLLYNREDKNQA